MTICSNGPLSIRALEPQDENLLVKWLSDPDVLQYYEGRDRPHDLEMVRKFYFRDNDETGCIVEYEGAPIGYIQYYPLGEAGKTAYGYHETDGVIYGTDQFIGETGYWNRGIGKLLIRTMVQYIIAELGADKVVMDHQTWNERAIACYEKCGFKRIGIMPEHEWHEGAKRDSWLMEY